MADWENKAGGGERFNVDLRKFCIVYLLRENKFMVYLKVVKYSLFFININ